MQTFNVSLGFIGTFIAAYGIAKLFGKPHSILLPDYVTYAPFTGYWNLVPLIGLTVYIGTLILWMFLKSKKAAHNNT